MGVAAGGRGPQTECSVDMDPRARLPSNPTNGRGWIKGSCIDVTGLNADDGRFVDGRQQISSHTSLRIHWHPVDAVTAQAQNAERLEDGDVDFGTDDDSQRRRAEQSILINIPAGALQ